MKIPSTFTPNHFVLPGMPTFTPAQLAAPGLPQAAPYEWFPCDDFNLEIDPESLLPTDDAAPPVVYDHNTLAQLQCLCRNEATRAQMHQWGYLCIHFEELYFYHADYLGHTEYITDAGGYPYQYFYYSPFGESLVTQKAEDQGAYNSPYRFNAKELDEETGNYYYGARYYNPKWSLWLGVDPMAGKGPQYSPYVFTFNNPILFVDPDGRWPYPVTFRSFHPSESFGKGKWFVPIGLGRDFSGDNRGFSLLDGASSRITHRVVADPEKGTVTYAGRGRNGTFSDASHHPYFGTDTDTPDGYVGRIRTGSNSVSFETGYEGTNPLAYGPTPDIDVDARLSMVQDGDILSITGQVFGDNFPNTEAFITDPSGKQKLFIGVDVRAAGEDQNPTILFGPATEQIMNINMQIRINPDNGNFIGVMRNGQLVKPDEWNKTFLNQNPNPQNY